MNEQKGAIDFSPLTKVVEETATRLLALVEEMQRCQLRDVMKHYLPDKLAKKLSQICPRALLPPLILNIGSERTIND